jgi:hypothetical protein
MDLTFEEIALIVGERFVQLAVFRDSKIANEARFLSTFCNDSEEWLDDVINYIYRSGDVLADQLMQKSKNFAETIDCVGINEEYYDQLIIMLAISLNEMINKHNLWMRNEAARIIWWYRPRSTPRAPESPVLEESEEEEEEIYIKRARRDSESTVDLTQERWLDLEIAQSPKDAFRTRRRNPDDILRDAAMYCLFVSIFCIPCVVLLILKYRQ